MCKEAKPHVGQEGDEVVTVDGGLDASKEPAVKLPPPSKKRSELAEDYGTNLVR